MGVEPNLAADVTGNVRPWWESPACLTLVVLATMIPLVYPPIPPLVDLFGHMGRYRVELDLDHSPWLQAYYDYHWAAIGNLGVDLLVIPLGKLIGLEWAVKAIVLAIPPLTAAGFLWVAREVHGRVPPTAFFALPFIYGYPVPVRLRELHAFGGAGVPGVRTLAEARAARAHRASRVAVRPDLARRLLLPHLRLGPARSDVLLGRRGPASRPRPHLVAAGIEAALRTSVMALPILIMLIWRSETHGGQTVDWFDWKIKWRWIYSALRDRWKWFDIASLVAAALVVPLRDCSAAS